MQAIPFDPLDYPHPSRRTVVYARNGMTCAGNPTAASVGLQVLLKGGNAVDAAVAMAAVMPLAEPTGNGLGSERLRDGMEGREALWSEWFRSFT